jgi:hypothetical protein
VIVCATFPSARCDHRLRISRLLDPRNTIVKPRTPQLNRNDPNPIITNFDPFKDQMAYGRDLAGNIPQNLFLAFFKSLQNGGLRIPCPDIKKLLKLGELFIEELTLGVPGHQLVAIFDYTKRLYAYAFYTKKAELATKNAELANLQTQLTNLWAQFQN